MDAMADFLRQAARDNGIPLTNAAVVLPSTEVFTRELTMPAMTEQQLRYNLPYEFRDFLTDEKSKYYFDYSMRDILRDQDGYPTEMTLLACAMLKETAERYRAMMRRAGFKLQVLTPSECAYAGVLAAYPPHRPAPAGYVHRQPGLHRRLSLHLPRRASSKAAGRSTWA